MERRSFFSRVILSGLALVGLAPLGPKSLRLSAFEIERGEILTVTGQLTHNVSTEVSGDLIIDGDLVVTGHLTVKGTLRSATFENVP